MIEAAHNREPSGEPVNSARDARAIIDGLAKPVGSLGTLERLAVALARSQNRVDPLTSPRRALLFAADHGVVAEGVGIWPASVTRSMVDLISDGRSVSAALARAAGADLVVVDAGTSGEPARNGGGYRDWRVGRGSRNLAHEPALAAAEFDAAWHVGERAAAEAIGEGARVVAVGDMGIGNTTAASCVVALLTGSSAGSVVGSGAGATSETLARKQKVVAEAVQKARATLDGDPVSAIAAVAGFEIVALAGCIAACGASRTTVVLDGFITAAAALIAVRLRPDALRSAIASHRGAEPGHRVALDALGLEPFLDWDLRLGEGSGALLLLPLLDAARALLVDVASLDDVVDRS